MGKLDLITKPFAKVGRFVDELALVGTVTGFLPVPAAVLGFAVVLGLLEFVVLPVVM